MRRWPYSLGRGSALATLLVCCGPAANTAPKNPPQYGEFHNPFPTEAFAPADTAPPTTPAEPARPAAPPPPLNRCGPACGQCSRASETCDEEVRTTGKWGAQCKRKDEICGPLLLLQKATGCTCE